MHTFSTQVSDQQWRDLLSGAASFTPFQTPEYNALFDARPDFEAFSAAAFDQQQQPQALINGYIQAEQNSLMKRFSARAVSVGGIAIDASLAPQSAYRLSAQLLEYTVKRLQGQSIYIEVRNHADSTGLANGYHANRFDYHEHLNFLVDTSDRETAWQRLSKSKKRQIKQSLKRGAQIVPASNLDQVRQWYAVLEDLYRNKVKKPLPSSGFFEDFYTKICQSGQGAILLVVYQDQVIGGMAMPLTDKTAYEWYVCGQDGVHQNIYPSVLATWAGIEFAADSGRSCFDFMGAGQPDQDYGVRDFKAKFGGELVSHGRYRRINKPLYWNLGKAAIKYYGVVQTMMQKKPIAG